jgi:hypothetical protein
MFRGMLQHLEHYEFCVCLCYVQVWIEAWHEVPNKRSISCILCLVTFALIKHFVFWLR